jgi:hypothetical protein
MQSD